MIAKFKNLFSLIDLKEFFISKAAYIIFFAFFFLYLTLGFKITFQNEIVVDINGLLYGADTWRVYNDFIKPDFAWARTLVHPLQLIEIQPLVYLLNGVFNSFRASIMFLSALSGALCTLLIYLISKNFLNKKFLIFLITLVFGLSYSTLIFVSIPETYIFASLFQILLLYYASEIRKNKSALKFSNYLVMAFLAILSFGMIPVNLIGCLVIILWITFEAKVEGGGLKAFLKTFFLIILFYIALSFLQKAVFPVSPIFFKNVYKEEAQYLNTKAPLLRVKEIAQRGGVQSFYALKTLKKYKYKGATFITFAPRQNFLRYVFASFFIVFPVLYFIFNYRKYENKKLILAMFSGVFLNFLSYFYYFSEGAFLYSQNFFSFLVIFLALLYDKMKTKPVLLTFIAFLSYQIIINLLELNESIAFISLDTKIPHSIFHWGFYSMIITLILVIAVYIINKILKENILKKPIVEKYNFICLIYLAVMIIFAINTILFKGLI